MPSLTGESTLSQRMDWNPDSIVWPHLTDNVFCATGPGGGIDPTCSPKGRRKAAPSLQEFKEKGATKEEIAEFNKLNKQRSELNKKVKAGTATDEERAKRDVVLGKLADLRMAIRARHEGTTTARSGDKVSLAGDTGTTDKTTIVGKKEDTPKKSSDPEKERQAKEAESQRQKEIWELASRPFFKGEEATLDRMKNRLQRRPIGQKLDDEMHAMMKEMEQDVGYSKVHGMTTAESMKSFKVDGLEVKYSEGARAAAAETMVNLVNGEKLPQKLWDANSTMIFTTQRNNADSYWAKQFNRPGFKSAATGGDGTICVYNKRDITKGTFAHESGHNLSYREWGSIYPDSSSAYRKAQRIEKPVSSYGSGNDAEDFAEATRLYVVGRDAFKRDFPLKHAALHAIITGEKTPPP